MYKLILITAVSAGLMACSSDPFASDNTAVTNNSDVVVANPTNTISPVSSGCGITSNSVADEKALLAAETAYNVPAQAYVTLGSNLKAETRTTVRGYLIQAYDYLKLARQAYNAGDNCSLIRYRDFVSSMGGKASALMPK